MGQSESRMQEKLLQTILLNKEGQAAQFLSDNPEYANTKLCGGRTNPMCRCAYLGRKNIIMLLLKAGADINTTSDDGRTALIWACYRNNESLVTYLIDEGAKIDIEDNDGANALDIAIARLNYETAYLLFTKGLKPKTLDFYETLSCYVKFDFDLMKQYFEEGVQTCERKVFKEKIKRELEEWYKKDLVIDPRESWGEMFTRIKNFEDPPLIPREELPEENQPHKSFYGKMSCFLNNIDPYPPEDEKEGQVDQKDNSNRIAPYVSRDNIDEEEVEDANQQSETHRSIEESRNPNYDRQSVPLSGSKNAQTFHESNNDPFDEAPESDRPSNYESIRVEMENTDQVHKNKKDNQFVEVEIDKQPQINNYNADSDENQASDLV